MTSSSAAIEHLLSSVAKVARGAHQSRLDSQTLAALERFAKYLVTVEGKGENTARAYKSLCAKAVARGTVDPDNPMMRSAVRALQRFWSNN